MRCPHLWSRSVTWLGLVDMGMPTKFGSSRALCPRLASSQSRTWPSSSRLLGSKLRRSNTSCPAGSCCLHPSAGCSAPACSSPRAAPCVRPCSRTASSKHVLVTFIYIALLTIQIVSKHLTVSLNWSVRTHCDHCIHQPTRWSMLPSQVATRPPPPPMESEASEVASCHSHSGLAQPGSRRAVTSCAPRRVETPSPEGPAY